MTARRVNLPRPTHLHLPFADDLVEVPGLLLHGVGQLLGAVDLHVHVLKLAAQTLLQLLQLDVLGVERLELLLSLLEASGQLPAVLLELLSPGNGRRDRSKEFRVVALVLLLE